MEQISTITTHTYRRIENSKLDKKVKYDKAIVRIKEETRVALWTLKTGRIPRSKMDYSGSMCEGGE